MIGLPGGIEKGGLDVLGLKKGVVVNIDATVRAIKMALEQAETMSGVKINTVYAGIAGSHVTGMNKEGVAAIWESSVDSALKMVGVAGDSLARRRADSLATTERKRLDSLQALRPRPDSAAAPAALTTPVPPKPRNC